MASSKPVVDSQLQEDFGRHIFVTVSFDRNLITKLALTGFPLLATPTLITGTVEDPCSVEARSQISQALVQETADQLRTVETRLAAVRAFKSLTAAEV